MSVITIERKVLEKNEAFARNNRETLAQRRIFTINIVSSPGSGKTSLIEQTLDRVKDAIRIGVIEGDVQTDLDAQRVAAYGVPTIQLVTNGGCHLEANLVADAMKRLPLEAMDVLIIENVGNLVCPANYDLGEDMKVVLLSVTEGDDKPLKYPSMFRNASVLIVNKVDLLPYVRSNVDTLVSHALQINPKLEVFKTSATNGDGVDEWCEWLKQQVSLRRKGS